MPREETSSRVHDGSIMNAIYRILMSGDEFAVIINLDVNAIVGW